MDAFNLQGRVSVDTRNANQNLQGLERNARKAQKALDALANAGKGGRSGAAQQAQQDARTIQDAAKATARAQEQAANQAARAQQQAAKQGFDAQQQNQRLSAQAARDSARAQVQATRDAAKAGNQSARDAAKTQIQAARDAARVQTQSARDSARNATQAGRDAARAQAQSARDTARQAIQAAKETQRAQEQAGREATRAAQQAAREQTRAAQQAAAAEQRATRESARVRRQAMREGALAASQLSAQMARGATMAGMAIVGGFGASLSIFDDYDRKLRNINSIAQLTEGGLQKMSDSVRAISADPSIRKGPRDLATGLYDIYSVGYKGAEALDVLKWSAKAASAGLSDTKTGVDAITTALKAHIKGATNARTAADGYFQTINDGKITFSQLASTIGKSAAFLKSAGVSFQEYGAYMADATVKGQKSAMATVNLNNLINKLAHPPKEAAKAFEELGIKFGYAELKSVGFTNKMMELLRKTKGSDDAVRRLFPDQRSFMAAQTILSEGMAGYNAMLDKQKHAHEGVGAAARAAAKQNQGLSNDVDQAKKNLEEFSLTAATTVVPAATQMLKRANELLQTFRALPKEAQANILKWTLFAGVALLVTGRLHGVISTAILVGKVFKGLSAAFEAAKLASLAGEAGTLNTALAGLGAISLPLVTAALAATVVAGGLWLINQQHNVESAARLEAANADLAASNKQVALSFDGLRRAATIDAGASKSVANLAAQYDKLKGSAAGMAQFQNIALPQARREIAVNVHLTMPQRGELNAQLDQVARQVNANMGARKFKQQVTVEADQGALANLRQAFYRTYGDLYDGFKALYVTPYVNAGKWAFGQVAYVAGVSFEGIKSGFGALGVGLKSAWYSLTGGFDSGFNQMLRRLSDAVTSFVGMISRKIGDAARHFWEWYNGRTANHGETNANAPSLPAGPAIVKGAPKSDVWKRAHGLPVGGNLPSYDVGTNFVPRDQIAQVHRGEIIIPAKESKEIRGRKFDLQNKINGLQGQIDARQITNSQTKGRSKDTQLLEWRIQLRDLKAQLRDVNHELGESTRAAGAATRRVVKSQIEELKEAAQGWRDYAQSIESAADRQIEALKSTREAASSSVQGLESNLLDSGAMSDKGIAQGFYSRVAKLERLLNSKPLDAIYATSRGAAKAANDRASGYDKQGEALGNSFSGGGSGGGFSSDGRNISGALVDTVARGLKVPSNISACANIAGRILQGIGLKLPKTNLARDLYQSARNANWTPVDPRQMRAGDLVTWRSARNGKKKYNENGHLVGYHTEVADSSTTTTGSPGKGMRFSQPLHHLSEIIVLRAPGGGPVSGGAATGGASKASAKNQARAMSIEGAPGVSIDAPNFARVMAQFNVRSLAPLLSKQPKPGEDNKLRRAILLDMAKLTPALHTEAAQRGLSGNKAVAWVKQVRDAFYDLANFSEKPINDKAAAEKTKAANAKRDEARKGLLEGGNAGAAQLDLSDKLLAQGKSFEEINAALEEQKNLLGRIDALKTAGFGASEAKTLALQAQALDRSNQARSDTIEWLQKQQMSVEEVGEAMGKQPSLAESFADAQKQLDDALANTQGDASDLQGALAALPATLANVVMASDAADSSVDGLKTKYAEFFETLERARKEEATRRVDEADRPRREAVAAAKSHFDEIGKDLDYRAKAAVTFDDKKRRTLDMKNEMQRQGLPIDPVQIRAAVNRDAWISQVESLTSGLHSIFLDSFQNTEGGFSGMCDNILGSFAKMLEQMAAQYLANFVMQQLFSGLSLSGLGGKAASAGKAVTGNGTRVSGGAKVAATGWERVPSDNYPAILHKNEAVLNAAQAESWRQQQKAKEVAVGGLGASTRRAVSQSYDERQPGGGSSGDIHLHLHGTTNVNAGQRSELAGELMGQRLPRRELQRRIQQGMRA